MASLAMKLRNELLPLAPDVPLGDKKRGGNMHGTRGNTTH